MTEKSQEIREGKTVGNGQRGMIPGDNGETSDETDTGKKEEQRGVETADRSDLHRLVVTQWYFIKAHIFPYCLHLSQQNENYCLHTY